MLRRQGFSLGDRSQSPRDILCMQPHFDLGQMGCQFSAVLCGIVQVLVASGSCANFFSGTGGQHARQTEAARLPLPMTQCLLGILIATFEPGAQTLDKIHVAPLRFTLRPLLAHNTRQI